VKERTLVGHFWLVKSGRAPINLWGARELKLPAVGLEGGGGEVPGGLPHDGALHCEIIEELYDGVKAFLGDVLVDRKAVFEDLHLELLPTDARGAVVVGEAIGGGGLGFDALDDHGREGMEVHLGVVGEEVGVVLKNWEQNRGEVEELSFNEGLLQRKK
jgi:hypothetical protein